MAPKDSDLSQGHADNGEASSKSHSSSQKRTRTKTGCLTCRKRRIKCDEGRPVCVNCRKSRRICDGYKIPLVFRSSEQASFATNPYNTNALNGSSYTYYQHEVGAAYPGVHSSVHGQLPPHPPPPPTIVPLTYAHPTTLSYTGAPSIDALPGSYHDSLASPHLNAIHDTRSDYFTRPEQSQVYSSSAFHAQNHPIHTPYLDGQIEPHYVLSPIISAPPILQSGLFQQVHSAHVPSIHHISSLTQPALLQAPLTEWDDSPVQQYSSSSLLPNRFEPILQTPLLATDTLSGFSDDPHAQNVNRVHADLSRAPLVFQSSDHNSEPCRRDKNEHRTTNLLPTNIFEQGLHTSPVQSVPHIGDLHLYTRGDTEPILNDADTKCTFQHFFRVTGSIFTSFDRGSPYDEPYLDQDSQPLAYPGLWTYTLPMMSLKNDGLLHSMLAHAKLQRAHRTGSSTTPAWKHYTQAWRRVHRDVRDPEKRRDVATFAATMCLAFYEVATADHSRWNMHLSGAAQLIREMDLSGMSKQLRRMRHDRNHARGAGADSARPNNNASFLDNILDQFADFDVEIMSQITGEPVYLDGSGKVWRKMQRPETHRAFSFDELTNYELYRDIFFWYLRQDLIHALVGGTDLLLDYKYWTDCPPRAPLGHGMAHYGAFDHLLLLIGRLVHWIQRDRRRKRRQFDNSSSMHKAPTRVQDGYRYSRQKSPLESTSAGASTLPTESRSRTAHPGASPRPPSFYGMTPNPVSSTMPSVFRSTTSTPMEPEIEDEEFSLEEATVQAFKEWASIRQAFDTFRNALGVDYEPLDEQTYPSFDTPFGRALHYRTTGIASLMTWFNMGLLVAHRAQPSMPPFATMAIGAAALQTRPIANTIGRIVAGIRPDYSQPPLRPCEAGAISDIALPFFFAAVQYRDAEQRAWAIDWHRRAEDVTGFASIAICAHGCESAWVAAAELGRGIPYERVTGIDVSGSMSEESSGASSNGSVSERDWKQRTDSSDSDGAAGLSQGNFITYKRGRQTMKVFPMYTVETADMARLSLVDARS